MADVEKIHDDMQHTRNETEHQKHMDHVKKESITITLDKQQAWKYSTFVLAALLAVSLFTGGFGGFELPSVGSDNDQPSAAAQPSGGAMGQHEPAAQPSREVDLEGVPFKGDADAPVTIVEFSDFQCPFCTRFYSQTLPQLEREYIDTGKVKFYYMDFPLESIHPQARPASNAAKCALEQGNDKFWEYHDILFENQQSLNDANYRAWAQQIGLDMTEFNDCYNSQRYNADVSRELAQGSNAGIRGTPGFLVNGQLVSGAQPFAAFQQIIEAELAS